MKPSGNDRTPNPMRGARDSRASPSPSPLPSPLGRGRIASRLAMNRSAPSSDQRGHRGFLFVGLVPPHKSVSRFSIPKGLDLPAQGCEARATLGCIAESCSTLKGLQHRAGLWRAAVVLVKWWNPFRVGESLDRKSTRL